MNIRFIYLRALNQITGQNFRRFTIVASILITSSFLERAIASTEKFAMTSSSASFFTTGLERELEEAIRSDDTSRIERAIRAGANVNARGKHEGTPIEIAVDAQMPNAVKALLAAGADPNLESIDGNSAVSLATESYQRRPSGRSILTMIMKSGGNPNALRPDREPVIQRFLNDHDFDDVRWFKNLGANLDILGRGPAPLITNVAMAQDWDGVWCLIQLGAKYDYENGQSNQPISMALRAVYSSPNSRLYPYKLKVWQLMKDKGLPVNPLKH